MDDGGDRERLNLPQYRKIFIQRDYSDGMAVKFQTEFPHELDGRVDPAVFQATINEINHIYADAESLKQRTCCESCFACLTGYLLYLCIDTYYEKCLKQVSRFIEDQNAKVYYPRGILLVDPIERGLRILEIWII